MVPSRLARPLAAAGLLAASLLLPGREASAQGLEIPGLAPAPSTPAPPPAAPVAAAPLPPAPPGPLEGWVRQRVPDRLEVPALFGLEAWQWIALPLLLLASWGVGWLLGMASRRLLLRLARGTEVDWDEEFLAKLGGGPLVLGWTLLVARGAVGALGLSSPTMRWLAGAATAGLVLTLFWALWRLVDVAGEAFRLSSWGKDDPSARSMVAMGVRIGRVGVVAVGLLTALSQLGLPVASLLAGLGIGGLALALAAQRTFENVFGSISIALDQPFRVGDGVKIDDFFGQVESIGLRSSRFRTLSRTVVTIPNGKLSEMKIESLSARDRLLMNWRLRLSWASTRAQVESCLAGFEEVLRRHPKVWPDLVVVKLREPGEWAIELDIYAWFATADPVEYVGIRQEVFLDFMDVVERAGTRFAVPARDVRLPGDGGGATAPAGGGA